MYVSFRELALKDAEPVMIDHDTGEVTSTQLIDRIVEVVDVDRATKTLTVELGGPLDRFCPPDQVGKYRTLRLGEWSTYHGDRPMKREYMRHYIKGHKVVKG